MQYLLISMISCLAVTYFDAVQHDRNLELASANPAVSEEKQIYKRVSPRHKLLTKKEKQLNESSSRNYYIQNLWYHQMKLHPHKYRYIQSLRSTNPLIYNKLMHSIPSYNERYLRNSHRIRFVKNKLTGIGTKRTKRLKLSVINNFETHRHNMLLNRLHGRRDKILEGMLPKSLNANRRKIITIQDQATVDSKASPLNRMGHNATHGRGKTRELKSPNHFEKSRWKILLQGLARFDLLYLVLLFVIFVLTASIGVLILPIASRCWSQCKWERQRKPLVKSPAEEMTVKSALLDETNGLISGESDSFKDMHRSFVSNEFDGEGDVVSKRLKLERWMMTQDSGRRKKRPPKAHRFYGVADLDSVAEEAQEGAKSVGETICQDECDQRDVECDSSDDSDKGRCNEKHRPASGRRSKERKPDKIESGPFSLAPNLDTVGRVYDSKRSNPRHVYSLLERPKISTLKRQSFSTIEVNPRYNPRLKQDALNIRY